MLGSCQEAGIRNSAPSRDDCFLIAINKRLGVTLTENILRGGAPPSGGVVDPPGAVALGLVVVLTALHLLDLLLFGGRVVLSGQGRMLLTPDDAWR